MLRMITPLLMLSLAACAGGGQQGVKPDPATPDTWRASGVVSDTVSGQKSPITDGWMRDFSSPILDSLVAEGMARNLDMQASAASLQASKARLSQAAARLFPTVNGQVNASRSKTIIETGGAPASITGNSFSLALGINWEADLWGRLAAGKRASAADFAASGADYEALRLLTAARVVQAWFAAIEARNQIALSEQAVASYQLSVQVIRGRFERGLSSGLDLRLALNQLSNEKARLETRQRTGQNSRRALEILLGRYPGGEIEIAAGLPTLTAGIPAGMPSDLLKRRPDIMAARARLSSAQYKTDAARAALWPSISLTSSVGTRSSDIGNLLSSDYLFWNLAGGLVQPIFQGGKLRADVKAASAAEKEVLVRYQQTVLVAFRDVETALFDTASLARQRGHLERSVTQAVAAEKTALKNYGQGLATILTLLDAQRRSFNARSELIGVKRTQLNTRVALHLALGGDFRQSSMPADTEQVNTEQPNNDYTSGSDE